ncbi:MAG: virulence RhuM family protein [Chloroflexota bacterium]|nr:virulence RhuM family protein [Chloroflexota bacterium]
MKKSVNQFPRSDIIMYASPEGDVKVEVYFKDETVWLTQKRMARLFRVQRPAITKHLKNIFTEGELDEIAVCSKMEHTASDGKVYQTNFYNLDAIIAVGYRVNSKQATKFRIWATKVLRNYIIKGFAIDTRRLKQGSRFGKDYFKELLEKIREIRASERRFYQKITDIYAQCSIDYDSKADESRMFFATVQNKLHWAITGKTAAELISIRADGSKPNMGLKTWKNAPKGKILQYDTVIAKNYLTEDELRHLNRIVSMYLDYAEIQAEKQTPMKMKDWIEKLDAFLEFNDYEILQNLGNVSTKVAKALAKTEYKTYRIKQDQNYESDFDRFIKEQLVEYETESK